MDERQWLESKDPAAMLRHLTHDAGYQSITPRVSGRKLRLLACALRRAAARHGWHPVRNKGWVEMERDGDDDRSGYSAESCVRLFLGEETVAPSPVAANLLRDIVGDPFQGVVRIAADVADSRILDEASAFTARHLPGTIILRMAWLTPDVVALAGSAYEDRSRTCNKCECRAVKCPDRDCYRGTVYGYAGRIETCRRCEGDGVIPCPDCNGTGTIDDGTLDPDRLAILSDALEEAGCVGDRCRRGGCVCGVLHPRMEYCPDCDGTGRVPHPLLDHLRSPGPHYRGCWALDLILGRE